MPPKKKSQKKAAPLKQDSTTSKKKVPAKNKPLRRDKTTFEQNVTASLYLQQKAPPNGFIVDSAVQLFNMASHALAPYVEHTFFGSWRGTPRSPYEKDEFIQAKMASLELECKSRSERLKKLKGRLGDKALPASKRAELEQTKRRLFAEVDELYCQKIGLVEELVREHAARRVDLFFYLMIAIYKKRLYFDLNGRKGTDKQHGSGQDVRGTAGCHSSLITNVKSATVANEKKLAEGKGILDSIKNAFNTVSNLPVVNAESFSWQDEEDEEDEEEEEDGSSDNLVAESKTTNTSAANSIFFNTAEDLKSENKEAETQDSKKGGSPEGDFLEGTYLSDLLNEVVELPEIVNDLDSIIERGNGKKTTKAALSILNKISLGEINPIEGLNEFAKVMHLCFETLEFKYGLFFESTGDSSVSNYPRSFRLARQLEREGTFRAFDQDNLTVSADYINLYFPFQPILEELRLDSLLVSLFSNQEFLDKLDEKFLEKQVEFLTPEKIWEERRLEDVRRLEEEKLLQDSALQISPK